jgi:nucleoid DNA-binding protein
MTMTRNSTVRAIGQRTRLKNRDVQLMLETLVEVWTEELVSGGRIELEHFMVIDVRVVEGYRNMTFSRQTFRQIKLRASKALREKLNHD